MVRITFDICVPSQSIMDDSFASKNLANITGAPGTLQVGLDKIHGQILVVKFSAFYYRTLPIILYKNDQIHRTMVAQKNAQFSFLAAKVW